MRIISTLILTAALAATAASAAPEPTKTQVRGEARLTKLLEGRTAGTPVNCINMRDIQQTQIIDGTAIVYRVSGNKLYVNRPVHPGTLDDDDILITDTRTPQLCNVDTIRLMSRISRFPTGVVFLNKFVPYTKAPAPKG
ncbi:hypothetical protein [Sphingomonas crocodyli]|uniref:Uncharacterized protein n=1 Tax=Sphingomonas crocodyli TaxID=1979270 RepID=A0A437M0P2_9SPHN|nr:hypothetical protein [Sphingomonas crocodyli]RVT91145.1 hypothetical protein EOD43_16635 [Sphingomonas crocodyli]